MTESYPGPVAALLRQDPIVITGLGAVSAAGLDVESLWSAVEERRSAAEWISLELPGGKRGRFPAFPVPPPDWSGHPWRSMARRLDRGAQYALHAARQAAEQAGLFSKPPAAGRLGVICGTSRGPKQKWEEAHELLRAGRRVKAPMAATTTLAAAAGALSQALNAEGPAWMLSSACASGAHAIAAAAEQILLGHADVMLAGGADDALNAVVIAGLEAAGVLAVPAGSAGGRTDGGAPEEDGRTDNGVGGEAGVGGAWELCRPFGLHRTGLVPGSGAGMLVLESLSSARRRGVRPLARLSGWALGMDPEGLAGMNPEGAGFQRVMRGALTMAGLRPEEIGYLNAHATGTPANDAAEAAAILAVFGADGPPVSGSKSITGHCLGATPGLEAVLCVEALRRGFLPPAFPAESADPACAGLHFSRGGEARGLRHTMSNSAAFWGFHASLVLSGAE